MTPEMFNSFTPPSTSIVDRLRHRAEHLGSQVAFTFLVDGEDEEIKLTYGQLDQRCQAIAAELQARGMEGERALLLFPPGLDFIAAFFGCLYAGVIAVPAYPPRRNRNMVRIQAIAEDAQAKVALTLSDVYDRMVPMFEETPKLKTIEWISTDKVEDKLAAKWNQTGITAETLAFLQYTSGSTGTPKGVMLNHGNMMHNSALISYAFEMTRSVRACFWLPMYHDMGLIGGVLQPMQIGQPNVLMSPMAFLQQPYRWLRAISKYQCNVSGGPNFAYELCVQKITPEQREKLDLSSWELAFNGAEPVKPETLDRFAKTFEPCGFRREAFYPCYGMAEATLIISGGMKKSPPVIQAVDGYSLDQHQVVDADPDDDGARSIVGCGNTLPDQRILIVDPDTFHKKQFDEVGEVWVQGPSIAKGYWRNEEATEKIFNAYTSDTDEGPFLRTGDLGFMQANGELFITGRLKDMIIVRGVNRYPQDIEQTVTQCHDLMDGMTAAAVMAEVADKERLIVVAEAPRAKRKDLTDIIAAIRREVAIEHEVSVDGVALIRRGSIPKTSSGKIQRHACREHFLTHTLPVLERWVAWDEVQVSEEIQRVKLRRAQLEAARADAEGLAVSDPLVRQRTVQMVIDKIREIAKDRGRQIEPDTDILELDLDSLERMEIIASIEDHYGARFPDDVLPSMRTVAQVADSIEIYLAGDEMLPASPGEIPQEMFGFSALPEYRQVRQISEQLGDLGLPNPYFQVLDSPTSATAIVDGKEVINFAGYNYLGLAEHAEVKKAAIQAIESLGVSTSGSRLISGERELHRDLESELAKFIGVQSSMLMSGGHAANETTIGHLLRTGDLILHDSMAHSSIITGANLSGARRRPYPHNDWRELDEILHDIRKDYRRVLIVAEGIYGMEGDVCPLPQLVEIRNRHKTWLMVNEAHSLGTLGNTGRGVCEHFSIDPNQIDIWIGTLSKAFGSAGGFVAGSHELIDYLKHTASGFVYSAGLSPPATAAALASLRELEQHPDWVAKLQQNADLVRDLAKKAGLNTGSSDKSPIVPIIVGDSMMTMILAQKLLADGVNARPLTYPAVEESAARLRLFVNAHHTKDQIRQTINKLAALWSKLQRENHASAG